MLRLVISHGHRVRTVPLTTATATVGSEIGNDIVVDCAGVSRRHAMLTRHGDVVLIEDAGSKNGIFVRGQRVARAELAPGDDVQLGRALLHLERVSSSDAELALRLSQRSSAETGTFGTGGVAPMLDESGARAAWRWVRDFELRGSAAGSVPELLETARKAIGAETVVAFTKKAAGIAFVALAGATPDEEELTAPSPDWIVAEGKVMLAARLTRGVLRGEWHRDYLEFVRAALFERAAEEQAPNDSADAVPRASTGFVVGPSPAMQQLLAEIEQIARGSIDVVITGETGVGKELVARMVHELGPTAGGPYVPVNCTAMVAELADADLFGVVRGAATGVEPREGYFAAADGGTIFLDEIADMPKALQPKLLRVLQERELVPVGSNKRRRIEVRVISSTNHDLDRAVADGRLRADLRYRLGTEIRVPALRERREDIPHLVLAFAAAAASAAHKRIAGVSRKALDRLTERDWPGNVRELKLAIDRAVLLCPRGGTIDSSHFTPLPPARGASMATDLETVQRDAIVETLRRTGGNRTKAARLLGISRQGLYAMLERFGLK